LRDEGADFQRGRRDVRFRRELDQPRQAGSQAVVCQPALAELFVERLEEPVGRVLRKSGDRISHAGIGEDLAFAPQRQTAVDQRLARQSRQRGRVSRRPCRHIPQRGLEGELSARRGCRLIGAIQAVAQAVGDDAPHNAVGIGGIDRLHSERLIIDRLSHRAGLDDEN
jgi:hypothetical protein